MYRGQDAKKVDSVLFNELFLRWREGNCPCKLSAAEKEFSEKLYAEGGEPVSATTVHSWRFKDNPAIGEKNLEILKKIFGVSVELLPAEQKNDGSNHDSQLALHFYTQISHFIDEIYFNPDEYIDELADRALEITNDLNAYMPFLSESMGELLKTAIVEILYPLTEMYTYVAEYSPEIGYFTEDCFYVTDIELLMKTHENIMAPFKAKLEKLAEDIKLLLEE